MAIQIADQFSYSGVKPLDARLQFSSVANMKAAAESTLYNGCFAYVTATKKYYSFDSTNTVDPETGKWREYSGGGSSYTAGDGINIEDDEISTDNMQSGDIADVTYPLPSPGPGVTSLGGLTDVALTDPQNGNALIYDSEHQIWVNGEGGKTYTAGDGINIDANDEISTDNMQSGDMEEVVETLPGIASRYHKYSTTEQIVGEWIDNSYVYEKVIDFGALPNNNVKTVAHGISNLNNIISINCVTKRASDSRYYPIPFADPTISTTLNINVRLDVVSSNVRIQTTFDMSDFTTTYVTLRYTKS